MPWNTTLNSFVQEDRDIKLKRDGNDEKLPMDQDLDHFLNNQTLQFLFQSIVLSCIVAWVTGLNNQRVWNKILKSLAPIFCKNHSTLDSKKIILYLFDSKLATCTSSSGSAFNC